MKWTPAEVLLPNGLACLLVHWVNLFLPLSGFARIQSFPLAQPVCFPAEADGAEEAAVARRTGVTAARQAWTTLAQLGAAGLYGFLLNFGVEDVVLRRRDFDCLLEDKEEPLKKQLKASEIISFCG